MRALSDAEYVAWLNEAGYGAKPEENYAYQYKLQRIWYDQTVPLARELCWMMKEANEYVLRVRAWDIFPCRENWHLWNTVQRALGNSAVFPTFRSYNFGADEADDLEAVLVLAIMFAVDVEVLTKPLAGGCFVSHDEYCRVYCNEGEKKIAEAIKSTFDKSGVIRK